MKSWILSLSCVVSIVCCVSRREYDAMGRVTKLTENYIDGTPGDDNDRITLYTYNADGQIVTQSDVHVAPSSDLHPGRGEEV